MCLGNLFIFLDFVTYCYSEDYQEGTFDRSLLKQASSAAIPIINTEAELKPEELMAETAGYFRIQDAQALYRRLAGGCRLDRGKELDQRV